MYINLLLRVSTEAEISSEEEDDDNESYDDSFIDDRINPTAGGTQAESRRVDMMAIYRLLTVSFSFFRHYLEFPIRKKLFSN